MVLSLTYRTPEGAVQKNLGQDDQTLVPGSSVQSDMVCEFDQPLEKVYPLKWERRSGFPLCIDVECTQRQVAVVLESLAETFRVVATVNRVHLGKAVPELSRHGADLFSSAPPEIRSTDSLHLAEISAAELPSMCEPLAEASRKNAVSLLITDKQPEQLRSDMNLAWAWYARPQLLQFHLTHGSRQLRQMLLSHVRCVVIWDADVLNRLNVFGLRDGLHYCEQKLRELSFT